MVWTFFLLRQLCGRILMGSEEGEVTKQKKSIASCYSHNWFRIRKWHVFERESIMRPIVSNRRDTQKNNTIIDTQWLIIIDTIKRPFGTIAVAIEPFICMWIEQNARCFDLSCFFYVSICQISNYRFRVFLNTRSPDGHFRMTDSAVGTQVWFNRTADLTGQLMVYVELIKTAWSRKTKIVVTIEMWCAPGTQKIH